MSGVHKNPTISFRITESERRQIEAKIIASGMSVSAKYSCGFTDPQVSPIIVVDRYLDYFTTIMEDRLWQVLAKPVFR